MKTQIIENQAGLTLEQIKKTVPAAFATRAAASRSERYVLIPTFKQIEPLLKAGWIVTKAQQRLTRRDGRDPRYTRHALTMRPAAMSKPMLKEVLPEVTLINSHDGQSKYSFYAGLMRLVCLNGLTVSSGPNARVVVRHTGKLEDLQAAAKAALTVALDSEKDVKRMMKTLLTDKEAIAFTQKAITEIYERDDLKAESFLATRREEDEGATLWKIFNVVQENIVRGGVMIDRSATHRSSTLRGITHVQRTIDVNALLWQQAMALAA